MATIQLQLSITFDESAESTLVELLRKVTRTPISPYDEQREARIRASQHANLAGQKMPTDQGLLIDLRAVAKLLNISERTVWGMADEGRMPKPIKIGRIARWRQEEIQAWVRAGAPAMSDWDWPLG